MLDLLAIGDTKLDTFVVLNDASVQCQLKEKECLLCLAYGAKIVVDVVDSQIAGSAPNVAVGLARMGKKTAVASLMGEDGTRTLALKRFKEEGVSTKYIRVDRHGPSAYAVVLNFKGEKTLLTSHTRCAYRLPKPMPEARWIYVGETGPGYEALYRSLAAHARRHPVRIAINPGTVQLEERKPAFLQLLRQTEVLFVNMEEGRRLAQTPAADIPELFVRLRALGPKTVIVTDGENGAYGTDGIFSYLCPIFPAHLVEATGAGDAFASGCLGALSAKQPLEEALRWGAVNSASVVGSVGPQAGLLSDAQIKTRLRKTKTFRVSAI